MIIYTRFEALMALKMEAGSMFILNKVQTALQNPEK
jgi:hypothetical protein